MCQRGTKPAVVPVASGGHVTAPVVGVLLACRGVSFRVWARARSSFNTKLIFALVLFTGSSRLWGRL